MGGRKAAEKSHLQFELQPRERGYRTDRWTVRSKGCVPLGTIFWYAPWRRYVMGPVDPRVHNVIFDAGCLREITAFLDKVNLEHKESLKARKNKE